MFKRVVATFLRASFWIALCLAAGVIGGLSARKAEQDYLALDKPPLSPPSWIFGPVWTALYTMMGISAYLVWRKAGWSNRGRKALGLFAFQLSLNTLWTPVFFGLGKFGYAAVIIMMLWITILATMLIFLPITAIAAALLVPYFVWVGFASYLNIAIWRFN